MNKSLLTNLATLLLVAVGYFTANDLIFSIGLFALSGAFTNWIAVHMLFEKVPGLYGSGVIPARFDDFKDGIKQLMLTQFFTAENIDRFLSDASGKAVQLNLRPVIDKTDFSPAYHALVDTIENSSFGGMLAMVGGKEALTPLEQPFVEKLKDAVIEISQDEQFSEALREELEQPEHLGDVQQKITLIIEQRLAELTPQLVKQIIQEMIRKHLGWLVVWGGVFGGVFGLIHGLL
ncbi:DUF445 domain-containing protein [Agarivorans sp. B2Z047]|uniref:DUF445 domain-containing protein n=1 Tax=Agarivorans sp. B2Z047 TaxID=2652721 RepID=UPI00128D012D|nr:DUF445 domain-containing protein [Agarivorans sp. B2Z047]MPW30611.1 DUF445 domain-containing protein [Agarivorans sp. B2Z047]UQN42165.1 DUF445 domain-containing protein [Agarivorans sp. B2Z047]